MKHKIKIFDSAFAHTPNGSFGCGNLNLPPTFFDWDRSDKKTGDLCIVTESSWWTIDSIHYPIRIGMLLEPPSIVPEQYTWISKPENYSKFTHILTHSKELLSIDERFKPMIFGGCWISPSQQQIYPKTKNISIIVSWKNMTEGHRLRHEVVKRFGDRIDVFGNGYTKVGSVLEALKDYKYTIVIENEKREGWFTEKILNALRTATVPIYWGAPDIGDYFDTSGICGFGDIAGLEGLLNQIDNSNYWPLDQIKGNFELAAQYCIPEDWLWLNYFKNWV